MGSFSGYSSPKTSYEPSYSVPSTPKASSYESSKVSSPSIPSSRVDFGKEDILNVSSSKSDLNSFRDLITSYLEVNEKIEKATETLSSLQQKKAALEERISSNPEFEKFSAMFTSINDSKGPKR